VRPIATLLVLVALLPLAACTDDAPVAEPAPTPTASSTAAPTPTPTAAPAKAARRTSAARFCSPTAGYAPFVALGAASGPRGVMWVQSWDHRVWASVDGREFREVRVR
jgi:hypothetical protein